ncbi:RNA polymerase factor sigma-54 [Alkalihalobacillus pseudalcaliphilus]|uniref:RNA polymerase factor sigma-54 n=1 Tax=Alkalihalobacillus pseudalcaliphilus TaxID=79884 RepID=UPI00064DF599|nr:RNA polymerase factor sigma-54 [Alkalihalobacillus pseudalcaliphilus]KMK74414.1 hypothetical protein AB990_21130 [Alkalihalobacillus pseudalcaliphilus]
MLDFSLVQKQKTELYMTTELRHAISLLQLSTQELIAHVEEQALENPLLELEQPKEKEIIKHDEVERYDFQMNARSYEREEESSWLEQVSDETNELQPFLLEQTRLLALSEQEFGRVAFIIQHLNDDGYLAFPLSELSYDLGISETEAEETLAIVQKLDPLGVGARNLQECLLIQLRGRKNRSPLTEKIITFHLESLANKKWKQIAKECEISLVDVQRVYDDIQTLQPRPGINYQSTLTKYVAPDVSTFIDRETGAITIQVHMERLPRIKVNEHYTQLNSEQLNEETNRYVRAKYDEVMWLMTSIKKRQSTLRRVTEVIVNYQADYIFNQKPLKPLILKDVADELDIHESTVSRVTNNKYLQSPRGLMELKAFFSVGIRSESVEEGNSTASIKDLMKQLIDNENKEKPLSDQRIVVALQKQYQIDISRRAVAKYRDELRIPSSSKRKRYL